MFFYDRVQLVALHIGIVSVACCACRLPVLEIRLPVIEMDY
jgi:hypothetical protein